jgi:hypothetical protein
MRVPGARRDHGSVSSRLFGESAKNNLRGRARKVNSQDQYQMRSLGSLPNHGHPKGRTRMTTIEAAVQTYHGRSDLLLAATTRPI